MNKPLWLDWAEVFDAWRVIPRGVLFAYSVWLVYVIDRLLTWYMALPIPAQTPQASGFCFGAIAAVSALGNGVFKIYSQHSRNWNTVPSKVSSVTASTVETK